MLRSVEQAAAGAVSRTQQPAGYFERRALAEAVDSATDSSRRALSAPAGADQRSPKARTRTFYRSHLSPPQYSRQTIKAVDLA